MPRASVAFIALLLGAGLHGQQQTPAPSQPFRTGTNIIRVDATVIDRHGIPVESLTADDFEVQEDGVRQQISSFKFIAANGESTDDRSLAIRSQAHAASEAARDDVRTFLIFWDEYHIDQFVNAFRAREAVKQAVLEAFGPTDLVAIMDQLTPGNAIEFTRDRRALADRAHTLAGRRGVYVPPRSAVEEMHLKVVMRPAQIELLRNQVTVSAIKAAAAHLGTLKEGRKTLIVVTEGIGAQWHGGALSQNSDTAATASDIIQTANDSNTAVFILDPRGLHMGAGVGGILESVAEGTGGELRHGNDLVGPFRRAVTQASAVYLLGYTRDIPTDGRFHKIKVRVKRPGLEVRARAGYWAPRAEDVERARKTAAAATLPPAVAEAFAALMPPGAPRLVDLWIGTAPPARDRAPVTVAWSPRAGSSGAARAATVSVVATGGVEVFRGVVAPEGTTFESPGGPLELALTIASGTGEMLDRETRSLEVPIADTSPLALATPVLFRARTPGEFRALSAAGAQPPIHAGREFQRTDRLLVRTRAYGSASREATAVAKLLDRRGATLVALQIRRAGPDGPFEVDLPLSSIAAGEFLLAIEAAAGEARDEALIPLRVVR